MPTRARKACVVPQCSALVPGGGPARCQAHRRAASREYEARRPDRAAIKAIYGSAAWRRARIEALSQTGGLCAECSLQATDVDHKLPIRDGGDPFDQGNLMPLCRSHHSRKTARETHARGRW